METAVGRVCVRCMSPAEFKDGMWQHVTPVTPDHRVYAGAATHKRSRRFREQEKRIMETQTQDAETETPDPADSASKKVAAKKGAKSTAKAAPKKAAAKAAPKSKGELSERDKGILAARKGGATYGAIAKDVGMSPMGVRAVVIRNGGDAS